MDRVEGPVSEPEERSERTSMANTKNITDRTERKSAKRTQRKALKKVITGLGPKDNKKFRKSEHTGVRAFLAEQNAGE
jgi:hypothetical protein